ncbi:BamA/TamA family outer membrane protein [Mucilaginibacter ginsenosidivorans]|uniref:BamA/TamA family outer membrane protein n=2 Tax=Mucilaginibacter ginsenosidivorans TaxID=398053 RepID=A0A5B8UW50_9SPHI|nr:BamA/TamA family outer membrane protein [Mucilaginibacter ginsenosidivorans]
MVKRMIVKDAQFGNIRFIHCVKLNTGLPVENIKKTHPPISNLMARTIQKIFMLILPGLLAAGSLSAQRRKYIPLRDPATQRSSRDSVAEADMGDVLHSVFHLPPAAKKKDTAGARPEISVVPALGYSLQSRLAVLLAGNAIFRTAPQSKVSTIVSNLAYTQNKQVTLPIQSSIWSHNNHYDFVGEIRLYHYPQSTFGLGSSSDIESEAPMNYDYLRFSEIVLRKISGNFYLGGGYIIDYHTNITIESTENGTVPDYLNYGVKSHTTSSGLTLNGQYDNRDSPINPFTGTYATFELRQNMKVLGSTSTWSSLILDVRKYVNFPAGSKNVLALWSYDWLTLSGAPPYLDLPSTLWDASTNAGRGYIQGRYRGAQMVYAEAEYRYRIIRNGLIGGVVFLNAQTFSAAPGTRLQSVQPGFGPGLRVKLNKVSRTNISIDYGFGTQGSHGLFVNVGELF